LNVALSGNLRLVCAGHPERGTWLAEQSFAAPIHLSKSYWDGHTLLVNVVNQTAGIFGGDTITANVVVEPGASVLLSSPSAARFHPSGGREARLEQSFDIHSGGFLDVCPELSIPQEDSRSCQRTSIEIEPGGELIYLETLAPGRVASGEIFAFARYAWSTDVHLAGRLIHRERAALSPRDSSISPLRALHPSDYYAGMLVISPIAEKWDADFSHTIAQIGMDGASKIGASRLPGGGWSIRILAADSRTIRHAITQARTEIYQRLGRPLPDLRRT
jgi:urease accessory protein